MKRPLPTTEDIEALRTEAAAAGDMHMVSLCDKALDGSSQKAYWACVEAIDAARAMDDGEVSR